MIELVCYKCKEIKADVQKRVDPTSYFNEVKPICDWCFAILTEDAEGDEDQ